MSTERQELEERYIRLVDGDENVDFNEADYKRLMQLRQEHTDARKAILAEAAAEQQRSLLRGAARIRAGLDQRKAANV
ncbi:hypothetical protein [Ferrovibrio sp.]|uniref:hypothetical protein n=1 Tax=Ferrovibrio sp. TaxID=1917215 RepID=UPI002633A749|nr:hypothetical protein [Ferrovibrio sp.]